MQNPTKGDVDEVAIVQFEGTLIGGEEALQLPDAVRGRAAPELHAGLIASFFDSVGRLVAFHTRPVGAENVDTRGDR
jgi:hypothetical protein